MNLPTENALTAEPATVAASMKLAILGATGSVGRELVTQALAAGHEVTALVRAQPKPGEIDDRVALALGDATSADAVKWTVEGPTRSSARSATPREHPTTSLRR